MVHCEEAKSPSKSPKDMAWYDRIGSAVKDRIQGGGKEDWMVDNGYNTDPQCIGNVPAEPRQWRGFAFAEAMEEGSGPGLVSTFSEAPADSDKQDQRLVVERNQNRTRYKLLTARGETLLVAKPAADGCRFEIFSASAAAKTADGASSMMGPAFVLSSSSEARTNWVLTCERCERCEQRGTRQFGKMELMKLFHYIESVGEGQAFCMDVELPRAQQDGSRAVCCQCCGDSTALERELTVRRPKWNAKHKSLTLDFNNRCSLASAKNFQLEDPNRPGKVKLLFGKIGEQRFTLDYRHPLGMVQAFAAALSASHWK